MAVISSSEPQASDPPAEAWLAELEDQIADEESWGDQRNTEAASIILHMFTSFPEKGYVAALEAALKIGADYWARFLPSSQDPLRKPYRFLVELSHLPKVTYKSEGEEYHAFHNDPVFGIMCEEEWNGKFASDRPEPEDPKQKQAFIRRCDQWVNFSSFQARYHGAEIYKPWSTHLKYPNVDIELALEKDLPKGKLAECRLLVASEWIIHAGKVIYADMKRINNDLWGLERWKSWAGKLEEILKAGEQSEDVTINLRAALDEMISIDRDILVGN
ncbi:hypothetical protein K4K49_004061 [Colletotrichum sp. SAR 10_70]|nr:hypothetical protein K4K50_007371 [Colletotrichum sp. SAR 10_71]KAI8171647.1 hypothetical protein K4K49_004061 [Colletotrichum sp. SAR 10_70]KAI8181919.1 hypothetical protein K4K51_001397 [Colletotrichum sp. SAR 10_75]KAI8197648.1 hypothetical protein KHU50_009376 [Colletotrichum sp. SAR 10_65]KAI8247143.1 hypothetical protein K4K53_002125 [Colletotrichum sp. SAR 10_77]KAJ5008211.1 hypothetical protein K4K48_006388 [Colletotrichum sp. SAR 10_66]